MYAIRLIAESSRTLFPPRDSKTLIMADFCQSRTPSEPVNSTPGTLGNAMLRMCRIIKDLIRLLA